MSSLEKEIVERKIAIILENLNALEPIAEMTDEQYSADIYKRKATERLLQELIEAAIDINMHIVTQVSDAVPDDYYESFIKAGELKIIPIELSKKLAPSAGLRNRLVHEYGNLDQSIILEAVVMAEDLYPKYIKAIKDFIGQNSQP